MSHDLTPFAKKGYKEAYSTLTPIWDLTAVNSTPVIAGGSDGNTVHMVDGRLEWWGIRPTAVRGVWRWWIRTLLAGLLWEEGYTCDYRGLAKLEEKLGLGTAREASKVFLDVKAKITASPCESSNCDIIRRIRNIPRYKLLTLGQRNGDKILLYKQPIPLHHVNLDITLYTRDKSFTKSYADLYKYALWLALALGGIGQATSRGFGKFQLEGPNGEEISKIDVDHILSKIRGTVEKINELDKITGCQKINKEEDLPLTPTFHRDTLNVEIIKQVNYIQVIPRRGGEEGCIKCRGPCRDIWQVLQSIGYATLKNSWKACKEGKLKTRGGKYHTWPLGLPRVVEQYDRNAIFVRIFDKYERVTRKIPTGYLFNKINHINEKRIPGRIQSLIRFTPFRNNNVIIYGFYTKDLELMLKKLYHYGYHRASMGKRRGLLTITPVRMYTQNRNPRDILDNGISYITNILKCSTTCKRCSGFL